MAVKTATTGKTIKVADVRVERGVKQGADGKLEVLVAKFQMTIGGTTVKLTSADVTKLVAAHNRAMAKLVKAEQDKALKAKKAAAVAAKAANPKVKAEAPKAPTAPSAPTAPKAERGVTKAQQQKAVDLMYQKSQIENEWRDAYQTAFDKAVAEGKYNGRDANDYARNNNALRNEPSVRQHEQNLDRVTMLLDSAAPCGKTYREIVAGLADGSIKRAAGLVNPAAATEEIAA